jgi:hypothetical protein
MQDDGEGLAFDTDSCATMKLSNHMVLYLKEVWRQAVPALRCRR